mgnify:CR=1 FL=1
MLKITAYVRSENSKKVMILEGNRQSFRCRQRNKYINGKKVNSLKFVSFKEMQKEIKKGNTEKMNGNYEYNTLAKL